MATNMPSSNTQQPQTQQPSPFKQQLDDAAIQAQERGNRTPSPQHPIVEKITNLIPAASAFIGNKKEEPENKAPPPPPGPPERSRHDPCIEEFVRAQHRSMHEDGKLEGAKD